MEINHEYEPCFVGTIVPGQRKPDFLFADPAGDPVIWEHLGVLSHDDHPRSWDRKREWYLQNGSQGVVSMFTTQDDDKASAYRDGRGESLRHPPTLCACTQAHFL